MATVQITTWDEFKTALTETITEATTYEIMNDIDVSGEIIESSTTIFMNSGYNKIFNGNSYKINGMTSYSAIGIFTITGTRNSNVTFNNLHFSNIMVQSGYFIYNSATISNSSYRIYFNSCLFNGLVSRFTSASNSSYQLYITFSQCTAKLNCSIFLYGRRGITLSNCYIDISPIPGLTTCDLYDRGSGYYSTLQNCYFTGKLYITYNTTDYIIGGTFWNSSSCYTNVFNIEVHITNYSSSTTYYWTAGSPPESRPELYNSDKIFDNAGNNITLGTRTNFWGLTDTQMKSRTYIQENTNFPLYG